MADPLVVTPFDPADLAGLVPQHAQALEAVGVADWRAMAACAASQGPAWTGRLGGRVIGCAGVALLWPGRAHAWCWLACDIPITAWPAIHRAVMRRLAQLPALGIRRLEAEAAFDFRAGNRWLRMLGFQDEGLARAFSPCGRDFVRYARIDERVVDVISEDAGQ